MTAHLPIYVSLLLALPVAVDPIDNGQWFREYLKTAEANAISTGAGVVVAVADSGVDANHPDLSGSILSGVDLTGSGDGRTDSNGHGTAMAGLIAAHGRVRGIAPGVKVYPIRTSVSGADSADRVALAIRHAVSAGAEVISISRAFDSDDLLLRQEVQKAIAADVVVVAAAGNRPLSTKVQFPAAIPGVVAVAGVGQDGNHSDISVSGPEVVIAAPSDGISSTDMGGGYRMWTGTSDAAAIVAGAVALVRAKFPGLKADEVIHRLTATAVDKGAPGRDSDYGYGVLNLVGALTANVPPLRTPVASVGSPHTSESGGPAGTGSRRGVVWALAAGVVVVAAVVVGLVAWRRRLR